MLSLEALSTSFYSSLFVIPATTTRPTGNNPFSLTHKCSGAPALWVAYPGSLRFFSGITDPLYAFVCLPPF